MKWFFRGILIIIGLIILIPIALILLMIDSAKPPVETYRTEESRGFTTNEVFASSMEHFLEDPANNEFGVELTQDEINTMIYQALKKNNPNYLIDDSDENKYVDKITEGVEVGIVGAWTKLEDDEITIKARADLIKPIKVGTSVSLKFKITFNVPGNPRQMKLQLTKAKIGNLPLPRSLVNTVVDKTGVDLKSIIEDALVINGQSVGTFDQATWTATIDKIKLVGGLMEGSGQQAMTTLIKILTYNELLDVVVDKSKIKLELKSSKLYLSEILDHVPEHKKLQSEAEKDAMLRSKGATMLLSSLGGEAGELYVNLSELEINKLLDFYLRDQSLHQTFKFGGEDYTLDISIPTIDIYPAGMHLNVQIKFFNQLDSSKSFVTTFKVEMVLKQEERGLQFELGRLKIGEHVTLSAEETEDLLELFGASEAVRNNMLVINNFLSSFASERITPKGSKTNEGFLTLTFQGSAAADTTIISNIQGVIQNVLGGVTSSNPEVQDIITDIATTPPGEVTPEQVQALMDNVDNLSPEEIQNIQDQLVAALSEEEAAALLAAYGGGSTP
ncbi:MAG: hypothetical protein ACOX5Y_01105 [Acholeplasmataceae bacterium]|jgi:hypothetical protein